MHATCMESLTAHYKYTCTCIVFFNMTNLGGIKFATSFKCILQDWILGITTCNVHNTVIRSYVSEISLYTHSITDTKFNKTIVNIAKRLK